MSEFQVGNWVKYKLGGELKLCEEDLGEISNIIGSKMEVNFVKCGLHNVNIEDVESVFIPENESKKGGGKRRKRKSRKKTKKNKSKSKRRRRTKRR